ncbi:MAG: hypothetical protein ABW189_02875 [Rickettsiales bacterium]
MGCETFILAHLPLEQRYLIECLHHYIVARGRHIDALIKKLEQNPFKSPAQINLLISLQNAKSCHEKSCVTHGELPNLEKIALKKLIKDYSV